jgi:hypothetical protein
MSTDRAMRVSRLIVRTVSHVGCADQRNDGTVSVTKRPSEVSYPPSDPGMIPDGLLLQFSRQKSVPSVNAAIRTG